MPVLPPRESATDIDELSGFIREMGTDPNFGGAEYNREIHREHLDTRPEIERGMPRPHMAEGTSTSADSSEGIHDDDMPGISSQDRGMYNLVVGHMKALQTAISVPLLSVVAKFDGDSEKYRTWVRELERYAQMAKLSPEELPRVAHLTCTGSVADF